MADSSRPRRWTLVLATALATTLANALIYLAIRAPPAAATARMSEHGATVEATSGEGDVVFLDVSVGADRARVAARPTGRGTIEFAPVSVAATTKRDSAESPRAVRPEPPPAEAVPPVRSDNTRHLLLPAADVSAPVVVAALGDRGVIRGSVRIAGAAPVMQELKRSTDPFCAKTRMNDEEVLVDGRGGLANVVVRVLGVPRVPPPATPVVIKQDNCMYRPRVALAVVGQRIQIFNDDPTLHNVHTYEGTSTLFNMAQIPNLGSPIERVRTTPGVLKLKCDVHQWMTGYVWVHDNAQIAITDAGGSFVIDGAPAGQFEVEAWHERLGTRRAKVTLAAGGTGEVDLSF